MGYAADFAPFTFATAAGARGSLTDLIDTVLAQTRFRAQFTEVDGSEATALLDGGAIDAFVPVAISSSRRRHLRFSIPLAETGGAWFIPKVASVTTPQIVATPASGPLAPIVRKQFPAIRVMEAPDYRSALAAAASGAADAAALNLEAGRLQAERDFPGVFELPDKWFCNVSLALALAKSKPCAFIGPFESALRALKNAGTTRPVER